MQLMSIRETIKRMGEWLATVIRELSKIPDYNSEADRLMRALRLGPSRHQREGFSDVL
ncbi:MAG: hypothetical protein ACRDFA_12900 [bacterium]